MDNLRQFVKESLLFLDVEVKSQEELLTFLAGQLKNAENVNGEFINGVIEREKNFPTGLLVNGIGCAIPHSEKEYVLKPAIALAVLKNDIRFKSMENPADDIPVKIVFMLAINDGEKQLSILQKIVDLIQSKQNMQKIIAADTKEKVIDALEHS